MEPREAYRAHKKGTMRSANGAKTKKKAPPADGTSHLLMMLTRILRRTPLIVNDWVVYNSRERVVSAKNDSTLHINQRWSEEIYKMSLYAILEQIQMLHSWRSLSWARRRRSERYHLEHLLPDLPRIGSTTTKRMTPSRGHFYIPR